MPCLKITILTLNNSKEVGAADKLQQIRKRFIAKTYKIQEPYRYASLQNHKQISLDLQT